MFAVPGDLLRVQELLSRAGCPSVLGISPMRVHISLNVSVPDGSLNYFVYPHGTSNLIAILGKPLEDLPMVMAVGGQVEQILAGYLMERGTDDVKP